MSAPKGNRYGAKPEADKASASLLLRCKAQDKKNWTAAAPAALAPWIVATLNRAAAAMVRARKLDQAKAKPG